MEVILKCCDQPICISCAYKSLKDKQHITNGEVQGIPGLILPQYYNIKGCCPFCKGIPDNKEEIITSFNFL